MLTVAFSNRFESLLESLLDALAQPPESPFDSAELIVPSSAVRRRIELAAADRFGICANVRFSYLAQWLWRQIGHLVPVSETSPFTTPVLTWRVLGIFADSAFADAHPPLARYLARADGVMRYELAARTAGLLEQYLAYRPDWLASWVAGKPAQIDGLDPALALHERWQGALWQRIARDLGTGSRHPSVVFFEAMREMGPEAPARASLPAAAHVFCLPATPPLYVEILQRLARWIDLRLYVLNPCREYWFEIVDPRQLSYLAAIRRAEHHETGNRLLAAWGKQTLAHVDLLLQADDAAVVDDAEFVTADGGTLLGQIQNAILELSDPPRGSVTLRPEDRSIEVHVCHSLTRELEVLHDQLLALFAAADPPRPSDILVVTPDLETAAPLIDAVFGNAPRSRTIPYVITGRPASAVNACARALLALLAVATSRFQASAVFELLQQPIIARRFGIGTAELESIHDWMRSSGIRWGLDAHHRGELGLPAVGRHSFSDGLDRLFLGYALPASACAPVNERLAAGDPEGSEALALGSFRELVRRLERLRDDLAEPKTAAGWRQTLLDAIGAFIAPVGDELDDARELAASIQELHANMAQGGIDQPLPADVVRAALQGSLSDATRGGIPTGAVTFSAMTSLRNLPYRFVCALGLNDGAFPSSVRPAEFDLMAHAARRGDRQRRTDERNVFLDLLLAAREWLYLSYTGRSVRDNSPLPPSVLVAELLDYAAEITDTAPFSRQTRAAARRRLVVEHPLQPFSLAYFAPGDDARLRSFNDEYCEALRQRLAMPSATAAAEPATSATASIQAAAVGTASPAGRASRSADDAGPGTGGATSRAGATDRDDLAAESADNGEAENGEIAWPPRERFFAFPLDPPGPEFRTVTLETLARFFVNPCRHLLEKRLGVALPRGDEELQDDEPFLPDKPARDALARRVLPRLLAGEPVADLADFARAGIEYPTGRLGELELSAELKRLGRFADTVGPALTEAPVAPISATLDFAIDAETWQLGGGLGDLRPGGLIRFRYDDVRARDYLMGWIEHLFVNALVPSGASRQTIWHSRDGCYRLPPVDDARAHLAALIRLYRDGLRRPLHFFLKSAWKYASEGESLAKAAHTWRCTPPHPYDESNDPAYRLALRGIDDPLDDEFERCAKVVFGPLYAIIDDPRL